VGHRLVDASAVVAAGGFRDPIEMRALDSDFYLKD